MKSEFFEKVYDGYLWKNRRGVSFFRISNLYLPFDGLDYIFCPGCGAKKNDQGFYRIFDIKHEQDCKVIAEIVKLKLQGEIV